MSNTWFTSDLHLGHKNIGKFRTCIPQEFLDAANGDGTLANELWIRHWWEKLVNKRDTVHCLGDNAFTEDGVDVICSLPGKKIAYGGNHDDLPLTSYMRAFDNIRGCVKLRKGRGWLSHFPTHPDELRGHFSNHGHTHFHEISDFRYINLCCDNLFVNIGRPLISLRELEQVQEKRRKSEKVEWL